MVTGVTWASHSPCYLIAVRSESWESCRLSCFPAEWVPAAAANAVPSMEKTFMFLSCLVVTEDMNYRDLPCLSAPFSPPPHSLSFLVFLYSLSCYVYVAQAGLDAETINQHLISSGYSQMGCTNQWGWRQTAMTTWSDEGTLTLASEYARVNSSISFGANFLIRVWKQCCPLYLPVLP